MSTANTSRDLETFAKHASRSTVNTSDVMLLARRNEGLETVLRGFVEDIRAKDGKKSTTVVKGKGRR
jgi:centromere protein S